MEDSEGVVTILDDGINTNLKTKQNLENQSDFIKKRFRNSNLIQKIADEENRKKTRKCAFLKDIMC